MLRKVEIERFSLIASKPFDDVVAAINAGIGHPNMDELWSSTKKARSETEMETSILRHLFRAGQKPISHETLLQEVGGYNPGVTTRTLETHIYRLRQKIEKDAAAPTILVTETGGYKLVP